MMAKLFCMKGVPYTEKRLRQWLKEDGGVFVQTKRDEFRCIVEVREDCDGQFVTYTSASGNPLYNLTCHSPTWMEIARITGQTKFDTGCSIDDSFDVTRRVLRASKKVYDTSGERTQTIQDIKKHVVLYTYVGPLKAKFWLYDMPNIKSDYDYTRRSVMNDIQLSWPALTGVPETARVIVNVKNPEGITQAVNDVMDFYSEAVRHGHEGAMVKRTFFDYKEGRTTDWMKLKPEEEVDGEVIGFTPGQDGFAGLVGSINCRAEDGSLFSISGFPMDLRQDITVDPASYLGRWVEALYMQRDSAGGYRHPRFYRWHPDK